MTYLNIWKAWAEAARSHRWCSVNWIHAHNMARADAVRQQLEARLRAHGVAIASCGRDVTPVLRALAAGLFMNAAHFGGVEYNPMRGDKDPGTNLYR